MNLLFRYIKNLGFLKGIDNWIRAEYLKKGRLKPKGVNTFVHLRPNTTDYKVFREIFLFRDYDFEMEVPQVIIDAGANVGYTSVFFANKYPSARIIAIEPEEDNFRMLELNTASYKKVKCIQGALMSSTDRFRILDNKEAEWAFQTVADVHGSIKGYTVDSIIESEKIDSISLLKVDIEGAEVDLFGTNTDRWLPKVRYIAIELHDWINPESSQTLFRALAGLNFTTTIYGGMIIIKMEG